MIIKAVAVALLTGTASAVDTFINVDFNATSASYGTFSGLGAASGAGTSWNGISVGFAGGPYAGFTSSALSSSTGGATPVTISLGGYNVYVAAENPAALAPNLMTNFVYQQVLGPGGPASTFSINNLDLTATYDVYLYAQNAGYANTATIFTINGTSQTASNAGNGGTFSLNTNYVRYLGLVPDGTGRISGTFNDFAPANNAAFNGMQIVQHGAPPPPPANAARTINVDFNTTNGTSGSYSGTAVALNAGTIWNGVGIGAEDGSVIGGFTSGTLLASDGSATSVAFSLGNFRAYDGDEAPAALAGALMQDFAYQPNLGPGGPDSAFSLSGLNTSFTYDLYLLAQNAGYAGTQTSFTINGVTKIASNGGNIGSFVENTNYVLFQGLSPDAFGNIFATFNCPKPADNAAFTGFQLVAIPEPATMAFLATGTVLALLRRRRS
jgi:hypothetical protein